MLFFNFLCLFYLMVLINSLTISKNIKHDERVDDIVDSIHDLEYRREYKPKHDRLHRYYRKEEKETKDAPKAQKEGDNIKSKAAKLVPDSTAVTKVAKTPTPALKSTKHFGLWQKFRNKGSEKSKAPKKDNGAHKRKAMHRRRSYRKKQHLESRTGDREFEYDDTAAYHKRRIPVKRIRHVNVTKRKRDVSNITTTRLSTRATTPISHLLNSKSTALFKLNTFKTYTPSPSADSLTKVLTALTLRVEDLKKKYAFEVKTYPTFTTESMTAMPTVTESLGTTAKNTADDGDFLGTAQIEALLNDIKLKAVQMVAEQRPAITNIITNTVTETTFEADPILTHSNSPGYALSTFISIDNDITFSKRTVRVETTSESKINDTVVIANTEPTHRVTVRSINEDFFTMAHTIEDMLQNELKKVYKKVKAKVSPQWNKEIKQVKSTIKKETQNMAKKITQALKKSSVASATTPMTRPETKSKTHSNRDKHNLRQLQRSPKRGKIDKNKVKVKTSQASTQSTFDDYVMLTLYEKILSKTHENNVMNMLTTQNEALNNQEYSRLFKRTPGTQVTVSLRPNDQKIYEEDILPDELLDYGTKSTNEYSVTESDAEDTSYEGLSNKISYNDYVNGYKHYLKFQKEQGNQNFSNLVRYQAHRHHSVDDIGKFILNKIPQLPTNITRLKRFFDDDIMEYQDISTKSDDSWFKKHFWIFIDNGPPKKYHTLQTVELKSPLTEPDAALPSTGSPGYTPRAKNKGLTENFESDGEGNEDNGDSIEDNLEQLSKALYESKNKKITNGMPGQTKDADMMGDDRNKQNNADIGIFKSFGPIGLVDKLFRGKGRKIKSNHNIKVKERAEELSEIEREKRSTKINIQNNDNLFSEIKRISTTLPDVIETRNKNYGYVDVNLIPRPTAIVKLRDNTKKNGKFKKLLNKFKFRKRKKDKQTTVKRAKRDYRVQRFNPFKKLKHIFKIKQMDKPAQPAEMHDYEMMTTHIDTFKPIKYNKVMSVDEIKGQIPNITEEVAQIHHSEHLKPEEKLGLGSEIQNMNQDSSLEVYDTSPVSDIKTPSASNLTGSQKLTSRKLPKLKPNVKNLSNMNIADNLEKFKPLQDSNFSIDMPDITNDPFINKFESHLGATWDGVTPLLDDIKNEINSLQMKLSIPDENRLSASTNRIASTSSFDNFSTKKMHVPSHILTSVGTPRINAKVNPKDIKIQTKLTRIAKFPLRSFSSDHSFKINPVIERPHISKYANEYKSPDEKVAIGFSPEKRIRKKSLNSYVSSRPDQGFNDFNSEDIYKKPYPDYFNDLLMWHGDLLNTDRLTSPQWEDILKVLKHGTEVTTLSMVDMQRELMQIRDYLKLDESLKRQDLKSMQSKFKEKLKDKTRSFKQPQDIIKTVACKDNTLAKGNDLVIQGESKYVHLIKQPEPDIRFINAADLLTNLNKVNKSPAIENITNKVHDAKRNGDFWTDNMDPKNKNNKDQESLLFLDTTLLSYDDGPDFLADHHPIHKKMSKFTPTTTNTHKNQDSPKPVAKINKSPAQYFSTPLPMRNNDFERFLKENQMDVKSVTTPLAGMPELVNGKSSTEAHFDKNTFHSKIANTFTPNKATVLVPSHFVTINPINFNLYTKINKNNDRSTSKALDANNYDYGEDLRHRRYSELRNERFFTFEPSRMKLKSGKVKKKIKLFDKKTKAPETSTMPDLKFTDFEPLKEDDSENNQVELTIINMNDIDPIYEQKHLTTVDNMQIDKQNPMTTRARKIEKIVASTEKTKVAVETHPLKQKIRMPDSLFPNQKNKNKSGEKLTKSLTFPQNSFTFDNIITDDVQTTTFNPIVSQELFHKFNVKHPPKRVKISSHSYKYDIIYQNQPSRRGSNFKAYSSEGPRYTGWFTPVPNYTEEQKLPYYSDLTQTIRKSGRIHEIIKIIRAVEAVQSYTKPNDIIRIDLPTYYMPYTGPTEKVVIPPRPKSMWNDFVVKYLSGLALIELLNKFGILKVFDGKMNLTDGVDNAVNASKVFSSAEHSGFEKEMNWRMKSRVGRQVTDPQLESNGGTETVVPNWREKRRLKLFSNIKGKLRTLLRRKSNNSSTLTPKFTSTKRDTTAGKGSMVDKAIRVKSDELPGEDIGMNDDSFNMDYEFDINRIVERAISDNKKAKKLVAKTKNKSIKETNENLMLSDADIPYLSPPSITAEKPLRKDNTTSVTVPALKEQTSEVTSSTKTTSSKNDPLSSIATPTTTTPKVNHDSREEVYFEPLIYDNKIYVEPGSQESTVTKQTIKPKGHILQTKSFETKLEKRDIQPPAKFTAKDVAALEIIVDLVKNTVNYEEREFLQEFTESYYQSHPVKVTTQAPKTTSGSNLIQVHIAVPYNLQVDKKRSLNSFKVKRVFQAKMFSPVNLEYQVQSFEDNTNPTIAAVPEDSIAPKMYLLIDSNGTLAKGNFPLKPLKGIVDLSNVRVRQVATTKAYSTEKAQTSSVKNIGRVTLSKDFVAAINKHLVQLYENLTALNESISNHNVRVRETNVKRESAKRSLRRHFNWDAVKKYFGHDRVCNCKCKPNRTMCRACAATDAVISELIFEFENLAKYMNDHCTEIQTFFWMNPSGGKKLRDTVHKVDQTLNAYFKRIRGKCQGRTCKTFSTCIDKRSHYFVTQKKMPKKYIGNPLIVDLQKLANDIDTTSNLGICYTDSLIDKGEALVNTLENCISDVKSREKSKAATSSRKTTATSKHKEKRMLKNVYSLDNISVNIICKPDSKAAIASSTKTMLPLVAYDSTAYDFIPSSSFYDYDTDEVQPKYKRKESRNFFNKKLGKHKMNHILTYFETKDTTPTRVYKKRQTGDKQIESPLVSDAGGSFWKTYMKDLPYPTDPTTTENSNDNSGIVTTSSNEFLQEKYTTNDSKEFIVITTGNPYPEKHVFQRDVNTTDYASMDTLSYNINELFKIFHNLTDLNEIESLSTRTCNLTEQQRYTRTKPKHTSKHPSKSTKIFESIKKTFHHKHKSNTTKSANITKTTPKTTPKVETTDDMNSVNTSDINLPSKATTLPTPSSTIAKNFKSTSISTTAKLASLKSSTNNKENSQKSHKDGHTSQSETTKPETSSATESTEPIESIQETLIHESQTPTEKPAKVNFLNKLKLATLDFFHNKAKELRKTTTPIAHTEEIRKSRQTPIADSNVNTYSGEFKTYKLEDTTNVISDATSDKNPTMLLFNEKDSKMNNDLDDSPGKESIEDINKDSSKEMNENFRTLLLSILNYEAKKLDSEWKRIKKEGSSDTSFPDYDDVTRESTRGIFGLYISTDSTPTAAESDYDLLKTLSELATKALEPDKNGNGLLHKIANKLGVKVVPDTNMNSEKPKATQAQSPAQRKGTNTLTPAPPRPQKTTKGPATIMKLPSHKDEKSNVKKLESKSKTVKLKPKYTQISHPKVMVRVQSYNQEEPKSETAQVCDIDATLEKIKKLVQQLPKKDFELYVRNKTCDRYKNLPTYFLIDIPHRKARKKVKNYLRDGGFSKKRPKWNWIRNKRSLNYNENDAAVIERGNGDVTAKEMKKSNVADQKSTKNFEIEKRKDAIENTTKLGSILSKLRHKVAAHNIPTKNLHVNRDVRQPDDSVFVMEGREYFEALVRDRNRIYRSSKKRKKRDNNIRDLETGLRNLPFSSRPNESYAMLGDSVIITCMTNKTNAQDDTSDFRWITDRKDMLLYDNVVVDGQTLMINEVETKNLGDYTCQKGNKAQRKVRLTIITLPTYNVIFTPFYTVDGQCTYDDLKAVQHLGPLMSKEVCSNDQLCSVRVDEPVCLRDRLTNAAYLRLRAVLSARPAVRLQCSARCRRDAHASLALMAATAAPALVSVPVLIRNGDSNKTLVPSILSGNRRTIVTHTLRRKDSIEHRDYYSHAFSLKRVNVIAACPAGYYLIEGQKICAACPIGSWSNAGDNSCAAKSPGDTLVSRFRRCYWWCPSCGWCAAGWGAACACAGAAAVLHARADRGRGVISAKAARAHTPPARPLSPSRVILAKFFRGSRSSTKATTDSQENKFGMWKEKHQPPPLPPIDFDM